MTDMQALAGEIVRRAGASKRFVVAIAGPPATGKSTLAEALAKALPEGEAIVVPMDGFHYDDGLLAKKGLSSRKGAPETFDFAGFETLLKRIRVHEPETAIPVFDRNMELARAGAAIIDETKKIILVEGNYLLLNEQPWARLKPLFDFTIFVDQSREELRRRLVQRWKHHGRADEDAARWIESNDLPNIDRVLGNRLPADLTI